MKPVLFAFGLLFLLASQSAFAQPDPADEGAEDQEFLFAPCKSEATLTKKGLSEFEFVFSGVPLRVAASGFIKTMDNAGGGLKIYNGEKTQEGDSIYKSFYNIYDVKITKIYKGDLGSSEGQEIRLASTRMCSKCSDYILSPEDIKNGPEEIYFYRVDGIDQKRFWTSTINTRVSANSKIKLSFDLCDIRELTPKLKSDLEKR